MKQEAVAAAVGDYLEKPWTPQTVWRIEKGERALDSDELVAMARILNVTIPTLLAPAWDEQMRTTLVGSVVMPSGEQLPASTIAELLEATVSDATVAQVAELKVSVGELEQAVGELRQRLEPTTSPPLTARQQAILQRIATGDGVRAIASDLGMTGEDVRAEMTAIMDKLGKEEAKR
jgi:DNA-binding CsgD family transcriptional regulator